MLISFFFYENCLKFIHNNFNLLSLGKQLSSFFQVLTLFILYFAWETINCTLICYIYKKYCLAYLPKNNLI